MWKPLLSLPPPNWTFSSWETYWPYWVWWPLSQGSYQENSELGSDSGPEIITEIQNKNVQLHNTRLWTYYLLRITFSLLDIFLPSHPPTSLLVNKARAEGSRTKFSKDSAGFLQENSSTIYGFQNGCKSLPIGGTKIDAPKQGQRCELPNHVQPEVSHPLYGEHPLVCVNPASLLHHAFPLLAVQYSGVVVGPLQSQISGAVPPYPGQLTRPAKPATRPKAVLSPQAVCRTLYRYSGSQPGSSIALSSYH